MKFQLRYNNRKYNISLFADRKKERERKCFGKKNLHFVKKKNCYEKKIPGTI